jgi:ribonuclease HII
MRDRLMLRIAKQYPEYGFGEHKGYGTEFHYKMLKKYGPSDVHRRTFLHLTESS